MRAEPGEAAVGREVEHASPGPARLVGALAKHRAQVRVGDLIRMVQHVAGEQGLAIL